ncbi:histidine kinase N-terminal 7TM domain-containing protein [Reinekea sp. G2M2-21]|uniref:histidine kinase N-terminal 7TM domain-containing protein n=1 Tax=Reinekea sp. G2M2-21 TaxID=2788942 RepID=UPI0018AB510A|nr:histidine kinase N-terminal 7TM domain-containing protein [Reinekea sp. G2M2-21]
MLEPILIAALLVNVVCLVLMWPRRQLQASRYFIAVLACQFLWESGFLLEIETNNVQTALFWDNVQFLPYLLISPCWLWMSRSLAGKPLFQGMGNPWVTLPLPVITVLLIPFDTQLNLIRVSYDLTLENNLLRYEFGPLLYLTVFWTFMLMISSIVILISAQWQMKHHFRVQIIAVMFGILFPLVMAIPSILGYSIFGLNDLTPFTFTVGNLAIVYGLFRQHAFEFQTVPQLPVLAQLPIGILILDHQERIIEWNPQALNLLNISIKEPGARIKVLPFADQLNVDEVFLWEHNQRYIDIQYRRLITQEKLDTFVITLADMTDKVKQKQSLEISNQTLNNVIRELKETQAYVLESEKHNMMVALIQSLAHEFNTPLGNLITLLDSPDLAHDDEYEPLLKNNVRRIIYLIERIKSISTIRTDDVPDTFSLKEVVCDIVTLQRHNSSAVQPATFEIDINESLVVTLPRIAIESCLVQLIDNSYKHGFQTIMVDSRICISADKSGNSLTLSYSDNGSGIPPDVRDSLFLPFANNSSRMSITSGVGLFSVHQWVTQSLHGRIRLLETDNGGAHFSIQCPADLTKL